MIGRPDKSEAAEFYWTYIDQVQGEDVLTALESHVDDAKAVFAAVSEERSLHRYAAGKWSIREVVNHVTDTERAFVFRALWFARGFDGALPGFDQNVAASGAKANDVSWAAHVNEFLQVRASTISFYRNVPSGAWMRTGIASDNLFSVRALAFITAGHAEHHLEAIRRLYLGEWATPSAPFWQ